MVIESSPTRSRWFVPPKPHSFVPGIPPISVRNKNVYAGRRIAIDIQEGVTKLKNFPAIGLPVLQASEPEKIRDLFIKNYTLRYLITEEDIYILRIWHNRENEKNV